MKLLLDANMSWRLIKLLSPHFEYVQHVDHCGLKVPATDSQIWEWAIGNDALIITNDEDYYYFSIQKGFPPKVVLLRTGNQSTQNLKDILIRHKDQILSLFHSSDHGLLEII